MSVSKEKIKEAALTLFAQKGYERTTLNDIANAVGIKKASLYFHFSGKDELFSALFDALASEFSIFIKKIMDDSKEMEVQEKLRYNFEEHIRYYNQHNEFHSFGNHIMHNAPIGLKDKLYSDIFRWTKDYYQQLEDIFLQGMDKGVIRRGDPEMNVLAFKAARDGLLTWMRIDLSLNDQCIGECWNIYWQGISV